MRLRSHHARTRGVAAVEFAVVAPILVGVLLGLWELGRLIQLQQILSNAAREGARVAAQSQTINSTGAPTQIMVDTGSPNVKQTVLNHLQRAGLNVSWSDLTVTFEYLKADGSVDPSKTQPYQGVKGQALRVTVQIPLAALRWSSLGIANPTTMSASVVWTCLVDDPFTIDDVLPNW